jgi:hypothetical protein
VQGEARRRGPEPAQSRVGLVRAHRLSQQSGIAPELIGAARARRHRPHDEIGMPSEILRDRDHRHIGAEAERPIKARAAPGVVHGEQGGRPASRRASAGTSWMS